MSALVCPVFLLCVCVSLSGRSGDALCSVRGRKSRDHGGIVQVDKVSAFVLHGDGVVRWGVVEKKMGLKTTTFGGARTGEIRLRQSPRSCPKPAAISTPSLPFHQLPGLCVVSALEHCFSGSDSAAQSIEHRPRARASSEAFVSGHFDIILFSIEVTPFGLCKST